MHLGIPRNDVALELRHYLVEPFLQTNQLSLQHVGHSLGLIVQLVLHQCENAR